MSLNHGINTTKKDTSYASVTRGTVGIPFFIGAFPCHQGDGFKGVPQIAYTFDEAKKAFGYSENWSKWNLCEAMYSQFRVFAQGPAIFYNVFNPATHKQAVATAAFAVTNHIATVSADAIIDDDLEVKSGESVLVKGTDYDAYYDESKLIIELLSAGSAYSATSINIAFNEAKTSSITDNDIIAAIEKIEECKARFGIVPDLIAAPGYSKKSAIAAVMATKAAAINGLFKGKAVVDIDTASTAADTYDDVATYKAANGYTDENMIVCWPLAKINDKTFNMSTLICGKLSEIDADNDNVPYESPSNKSLPISGCVNAAGAEVLLSIQQADTVSYTAGVVTAINYDGWVVWGNYTGCKGVSTDVAKVFICTNRMMDYICNTFVNTYWAYLDRPLTRVLIDAVVNEFNSFLAGLTGEGKLYGGEISYVEDNNSTENLIAGHFRLDCKVASPVPAQRIDMFVEFDIDTLTSSINA